MAGHKHKQTYEVVVAADAAAEAIEVAAEALPPDAVVVESSATPLDDPEGASWQVVLTFTGGARRKKMPVA